MCNGRYKIPNQAELHFVSFAVAEWVDVFQERDIVIFLLIALSSVSIIKDCWFTAGA